MKQASIRIENGTLIIDFQNLFYASLHSNVVVKISDDKQSVTVIGIKEKWEIMSAVYESEYEKLSDPDFIAQIEDKYIEIVPGYVKAKFFGLKIKAYPSYKRVGNSMFVKYKEEKPVCYTATNYIIKGTNNGNEPCNG